METSNTAIAPAASGSHFYHRQHHKNNSNSDQSNIHHRVILTFHSIIIITVSVIAVVVLVALLLLVALMLMRKRRINKSSKDSHGTGSFDDIGGAGGGSSRFISHTTINFTTSSPDVEGGGCFYGGHVKSSYSTNVPTVAAASMRYKGVVQVFTYKELEMATGRFSEGNVIRNNGGFWTVYRGVLSDGTVAAVKKFHRDGKQVERAFRMEVDLLSSLHSPYLVELLGYCADQNHRLLVSEYIPNGPLQKHLHNPHNQCQPLDWGTRLIIALDCARALEFLHEQATPPVIHRDLNSSNVLLDQNFRAKVTEFGLAKMVSDKINGQISTRVLGTTGYLAPEYAATGKLTTKSDVYSYGVVLLELLTGRVPAVDTNRPPGEQVLVSWALPRLTSRENVVEMVDPSLRGQYSKKDLAQVAAIAAVCVQPEADYRPLMTDVVQSLIPLAKNNANGAMCFGSSRFQQQTPSPRHLQKI